MDLPEPHQHNTQRPFQGRRVGFAGPMLGSHPGWVVSQQELLAARMSAEGAVVLSTSDRIRRLERLVDTVRSLRGWRGQVDVVVIAVFSGPGFWLADLTSRIARCYGMPQVLVLRGGNLAEFVRRHPLGVQRLFGRADAVVAPSQFLASEMPPTRSGISVIPNVFDIGTIPWNERKSISPRLLWMRTFHPIYNPLLALEALALLKERHPETTLTMAGQDKGLRDACIERAQELGLSESVTFPGFLDETKKRHAFGDHDVFLNTNDVDNTPVSVLEAAAAGMPVVATRIGGLPYLFRDGQDALLVPPGDAAAMASAVGRLFANPELTQRLSSGGRAVAEASDWGKVRTQWLDLLGDLSPETSERERIQAVYDGYKKSGRETDRWDDDAPGNRCILDERRALIKGAIASRPPPQRVLEIGCGRGAVLGDLADALPTDTHLSGVDLLSDRLIDAHSADHSVAQADGRHLPFVDNQFDLVVAFTVFSSIPDRAIRLTLANEVRRVLKPGGALLWHDLRFPSPNRSVRPLGRSAVGDLFPSMQVQLESRTVLPPLARRLGDRDRQLYPWLKKVPALRSHLFGVIS